MAHHVAHASFHAVADDGVAHLAGDNKTHPGGPGWIGCWPVHVHHHGAIAGPDPSLDGDAEVS